MSNVETMTRTAELAGLIYKNMKMGADSIINLLPKVEDEKVKTRMTEQLDGYEKYAKQARRILEAEDVAPREEGMMAKMGAKMGISMKTMAAMKLTVDDIMDFAGLPLMGVVPEDAQVTLSAAFGKPLLQGNKRLAAAACRRIAKRIKGYNVPIDI